MDRDFHLRYKKVLGLRTSALLLVKEFAVDSAYGLVSVCRINKNRNLDFACADHLDVDLSVIKLSLIHI